MDTVQVALRIRPMLESELERGCRSCIETIPGVPQVRILKNSFTYNYVFDHHVPQNDVYEGAVKNLVQQLFNGYNVTVLAYGQTGSGKTHSMGTNYPVNADRGIIPRAVDDIFEKVAAEEDWEFEIKVSFLELYNEQLYDLLAGKSKELSMMDIREDSRGICIPGLTEMNVKTADDVLQCLQQGSQGRATGATAMNAQSSRSHAIFTIYIYQSKKGSEAQAMSAKFHLVDLAGSERSKKTKAIGDRFKEGININKGLFILGNVISALGEGNHNFINYRDSKLTRLLQDSLGGNALTIMIACVSPADDNHHETLSTLRYADRARKIKNKPIVNKDPKSAEIERLKKENEELRLELLAQGVDSVSHCPPEHAVIVKKLKTISDALSDSLAQNAAMCERALIAEKASDCMKEKLKELTSKCSKVVDSFHTTLNESQLNDLKQLQTNIVDLQAIQQKNDEEIISHERSLDMRSPISFPAHDKDGVANSSLEDAEQEMYLMEATELNKQLQELTKNLAWKEQIVLNMVSSSSQMSGLHLVGEKNLKDLEEQIKELQKERDELNSQVKNIQTNNASNKLAEQRRKRLQELEQKISVLNKKVTEQARIIKMKESSDKKIINLNEEILNMKKTRVRLINQMKIEGDKYRAWKVERERELYKLKQQDRQHQNQISKLKCMHLKEKNVLKRKAEEAAAINKRLKDALSLQKNVQEKRNLQGNPERISQWIHEELEIMLSTLEAERTLEHLAEDRATLNKALQNLKTKMNEVNLNKEDKMALEREIKDLNQNLNLRCIQIMDLKQKIEDSDQDNKARTRWETVQSMFDAKCALQCLFEVTAEAKKDLTTKEILLQEMRVTHNDLLKKTEQEAFVQHRMIQKLEQEYEDKIYLLLRQLQELENGNNISDCKEEIMRIQEDELSKVDELRRTVEFYMNKCDELEKLKVLSSIENKPKKQKKISELKVAEMTPPKPLTPDIVLSDDDLKNDPDWRKTPLFKRLKSLKQRLKRGDGKALKRSNDGSAKCMCRSNCSRKFCSCRKMESFCSSECGCDVGVCLNRDTHPLQKASTDNITNENEDPVKKIKLNFESSPELSDAVNTTYTTADSSLPSTSSSSPPGLNTTFLKPSDPR